MKREVPAIIVFLTGLAMLAERFLNVPSLGQAAGSIRNWGIIIAAFALVTGALNLIGIHTANIRARRNALYSGVLVASMVVMTVVGVFMGAGSKPVKFLYDSLLGPMTVTMDGVLAFYLASAAYRAFVARNLEASVLLITGIIVMLDQVGLGRLIYGQFGQISAWLMDVPNLAGQRGLMIGSAIGAITVGVRVLLGIDRAHFGGGE